MDTSVIIVGAGPVGLMLAGELRLRGVDVTVYERRPTRGRESRGVGFTARATEIFQQRGLLARLGPVEISRQGHFGGIPLDFGVLPGSHFGVRGVPQYRIEEVLEEWVGELGVRVLRGHDVVDLRVAADSVTAVVDSTGGRLERTAGYLVGCDGGHSSIRLLGGFDFPGTDATREMYLADVVGMAIRPRPIGERVPGGMVMSGPLEEGVDRIIVCPVGAPPPAGRREPGFAEVADAWQRLTGESLHGARAIWVSAFTDATRQVSEYRRGRVLLAGDAAHIHLPAGGQGLSLGVQDAVNLGWKLAGAVHGWAPADLLDTYHRERHAVGKRVLRNTLAQGMLYLSGPEIEPMRNIMAELMAIPAVGSHLSGMVSGLDIRYAADPAAHPLTGMRLPAGDVVLPDGRSVPVQDLLPQSRGAIVSRADPAVVGRLVAGWLDRVDLVPVRELPVGVRAQDGAAQDGAAESVLVRPDGYLAWVGPADGDVREALLRWFGAPRLAAPDQPADQRALAV